MWENTAPWYWISPYLLCRDQSAAARRCACFYVNMICPMLNMYDLGVIYHKFTIYKIDLSLKHLLGFNILNTGIVTFYIKRLHISLSLTYSYINTPTHILTYIFYPPSQSGNQSTVSTDCGRSLCEWSERGQKTPSSIFSPEWVREIYPYFGPLLNL